MRFATSVALILALTACADDHVRPDPRCVDGDEVATGVSPTDDDENVTPASSDAALGGICDGSTAIRLVVASQNGPGTLQAFGWRNDSSRPLLIVDGQCHYYASGVDFGPVTQGDLTAETLAQLTEDLGLDHLGSLPSRRDDCADHWSDRLIATADASLRCRCDDCGEGTASTAAMQNGVAWIERLAKEGEPLTGVLAAQALPGEPVMNGGGWKTQTVFDWPLETSIERIKDLSGEYIRPPRGAYFSGDAAEKLRELRAKGSGMVLSPTLDIKPFVLYVRDCGETYSLNLRDELPARIETELERFVDAGWKRPRIPSCVTFPNTEPTSPCPP